MSNRTRLPVSHFRPSQPGQPAIQPIGTWSPANRGFYDKFRDWLREGGYGPSALDLYSVAARLALGLLDQPYWQLDPETDLDRVRQYLARHYPSPGTRSSYDKGLAKLADYLAHRNRRPRPEKPVNWPYYLAGLPPDWTALIRDFVAHCQRSWLPEQRRRATLDSLSHLTRSLRWLVAQSALTRLAELTPNAWFDYVDARLLAGIKPVTLNGELHQLQAFLRFLAETGQPVDTRLLRLEPLGESAPLPRDVPLDQLRCLLRQIETEAAVDHAGWRRLGLLDKAWFLLMLHSGLRTGEVRRLRRADLDLPGGRARIEQAKGLKDRVVFLSPAAVEALAAYLAVRGEATTDHVFLYRHRPLSVTYCLQRLKTYGERCGVTVTPHQLRHSCATLLLNAGAPILTVQALLGHKHIDTTLGYARLYDDTVTADYYQAMNQIEPQLALAEVPEPPNTPAHLLAMVDALQGGTLNETQRETVQTLRQAILTLIAPETEPDAFKDTALVTGPMTKQEVA